MPSAFVPSLYSVSKMSSSISVQKFKHRVHRRLLPGDYTEYLKVQRIHRLASPHGRQLPWNPMFRKELCVPSAFVPSLYSVSKMSSSISVQKFKHRVHKRLLPGDYTEYLKVQRIHRLASPHGHQLPWNPMFRKELCVPLAFVPSLYSVSKMSFSISVQKFKHGVHRRLLPEDYTEYLKVQRIHRLPSTSILLHRYALHVTFLLMVICRGQGERKFIIIYNIYITYNNNFIYILIYNLFTLKIYILLLSVLLCLFCP